MGRGNTCVFGDYEGLFYIDWDNFGAEYEDENGNIVEDYDLQQEDWENSLEQFISDFTQKFKSFSRCDKWTDTSRRNCNGKVENSARREPIPAKEKLRRRMKK